MNIGDTKEMVLANIKDYDRYHQEKLRKAGFIKLTAIYKWTILGSVKVKELHYFTDKVYENMNYKEFQNLVYGS